MTDIEKLVEECARDAVQSVQRAADLTLQKNLALANAASEAAEARATAAAPAQPWRAAKMGEGKQTCVQCNGTGWWQYDHNHAAVCPVCCPHDKGWWLLTEHYAGYRPGRETWCCKRGCGFTCDSPSSPPRT